MDKEEKSLYAHEVFKLVKAQDERLERGYILRKAMFKDLTDGKKPSGYRPEFVLSSAQKVVALAQTLAENFDLQHGDDKCSVHDMLDVLETAKQTLRKRIKKEK